MVVWSATFPKLSLVSSNVIVMLASKLVSTVVLRDFTIVNLQLTHIEAGKYLSVLYELRSRM